jgi:hypothetical protein
LRNQFDFIAIDVFVVVEIEPSVDEYISSIVVFAVITTIRGFNNDDDSWSFSVGVDLVIFSINTVSVQIVKVNLVGSQVGSSCH